MSEGSSSTGHRRSVSADFALQRLPRDVVHSIALAGSTLDDAAQSVCTMLHCQLANDDEESFSASKYRQNGNWSLFDEEAYGAPPIDQCPTLEEMVAFVTQMFEVGRLQSELLILVLIYINRIVGRRRLTLTPSNWKIVFTVSTMVTQKIWEDTPLLNSEFSYIFPLLSNKQLNRLEQEFVQMIDFDLQVSSSLYYKYYFELRSAIIYCRISDQVAKSERTPKASTSLTLCPLLTNRLIDTYQANKLEFRKKTTTIEDLERRYSHNLRDSIITLIV